MEDRTGQNKEPLSSLACLPEARAVPVDGQRGVLPHPDAVVGRVLGGVREVLHHAGLHPHAVRAHVHLLAEAGVNGGDVVAAFTVMVMVIVIVIVMVIVMAVRRRSVMAMVLVTRSEKWVGRK
jgi:hypothetical protein